MASTKQRISEIIYEASVTCAGIDENLANGTEAGKLEAAPIQIAMILAIASEHGIEISNAAATELLSMISSTMQSRQLLYSRQALVGWLPGIDDANNDSTMAALTEAIGWAANSHFDQAAANK